MNHAQAELVLMLSNKPLATTGYMVEMTVHERLRTSGIYSIIWNKKLREDSLERASFATQASTPLLCNSSKYTIRHSEVKRRRSSELLK